MSKQDCELKIVPPKTLWLLCRASLPVASAPKSLLYSLYNARDWPWEPVSHVHTFPFRFLSKQIRHVFSSRNDVSWRTWFLFSKSPKINFKPPFLDVSDNLLNIYRLENIYWASFYTGKSRFSFTQNVWNLKISLTPTGARNPHTQKAGFVTYPNDI